MLVKRISTAMIALFCLCQIAHADVGFNTGSFTVDVDVNVSTTAGESVIVAITDATNGDMSSVNPPVYMYPHFTDDAGAIKTAIPLSKNINTGKYNVMLSNSTYKEVYTITVINDNDKDTKDILNKINSSTDANEIYTLLTTENNAIKVGIDLSDAAVASNLKYAISFIINRRGYKTYTVDTLQNALSLGIMCCDITNGKDIDTVMVDNATLFGTTYENYANLDSKKQAIVKSILSKADYINNDAKDIYDQAIAIAEIRTARAWAYLQDYLLANADSIGIDIGDKSDYAKIKEANRYKVFQAMYKNIANYNSYTDVVNDFNKQVKAVKNEDASSTKPSSSGGGGGGGGGGSATTSVVAPTGTSAEASKQDEYIAWLLTPFTIKDATAIKAKLIQLIK